MSIFTTIPARPNVTPSDIFKERGNFTDMPVPVFEASVSGNTSTSNPHLSTFRGAFQYHVAANVLKKKILGQGFCDTEIPSTESYIPLLPTPPVGLLVPGKDSPAVKQTLLASGFTEEAVGNRKFYRGIVERVGLNRIMEMNPTMDVSVPYGVTNLEV